MTDGGAPLTGDPSGEIDRLVERLKIDIGLGRFRPRERLIEDELCARFDASRHLIRSVFSRLENMGLIVRRPNKGVIVRDFNPEELSEIYDMRALLQGEAARRIPLPGAPDLVERLHRIHSEYLAAAGRGDAPRLCALDEEFHRTLFAAAANRYLSQMIEGLWTETLSVRGQAINDPAFRAQFGETQGLIIEALRSGDRARLEWLLVDSVWGPYNAYRKNGGLMSHDLDDQPASLVGSPRTA
jgi:DNA-binding GntR family transcriptional regulator